jgi:hypothetical protein
MNARSFRIAFAAEEPALYKLRPYLAPKSGYDELPDTDYYVPKTEASRGWLFITGATPCQ